MPSLKVIEENLQRRMQFLRARDYAYKLLSYRPRSTQELKGRLKMKSFPLKVINKTVRHLTELNYLNDRRFVRYWIENRMRSAPVGLPLLRYQLKQRGISEAVLEDVLCCYAGRYDEPEAARRVFNVRRRLYRGLAPQRLKQRLYMYLKRRGFSDEIVLPLLNQLKEDK